jgi:hypothetical protein
LAVSESLAAAGRISLAELLFSPRAAFVWHSGRRAVTWMNPAARTGFNSSIQEFTQSIPAEFAERFSRYGEIAADTGQALFFDKLKLGSRKVMHCSVDVIELMDGATGLIVAKIEKPEPAAVLILEQAQKTKRAARPKLGPAAKKVRKKKRNLVPVPRLTSAEQRSFKAIGRAVRKLCKEKRGNRSAQDGREQPCIPLSLPAPPQPASPLLLAAFDLVLFLNDDFEIIRIEGRPQRLGWRRPSLQGKLAATILPPSEQALFYRVAKKSQAASAQILHEALIVSNESGDAVPCRAILARWPSPNAEYIFALLSLKLPQRLEKYQPQPVSIEANVRLAA